MELTFGQMVDELRKGQTAESDLYQATILNGKLVVCGKNTDVFYDITERVIKKKWTILPQYVPFEEAMKALKEGKIVIAHAIEGTALEDIGYSMSQQAIGFDVRRINGKWSIQE
jgi:hypothetical protein